jgi:pectate lyase
MRKFTQYLKESIEDKNFDNLRNEVEKMIHTTIENSGGEFKSFVSEYIKSPEDVTIEGLINDSDIYDFYLKYRNDIDELLNNVRYFYETPSENNIIGLYDYIIKGTQRSILEITKTL